MAKRLLKDWTQSERVNELSPMAEVFFTRLIMKADDYGRFYGNAKLLNAALFPLRDMIDRDILPLVDACERAGLIIKYTALEKQYICIVDFGQRLRVMNSKFPKPEESSETNVRSFVSNPPPTAARSEVELELELELEEKIEPAANANSIYTACVDIWLKEIHVGWTFGGQQGKALKSLIKKIQQKLTEAGFPHNNTAESFRMFCYGVPEWYKSKDLSILDSKFNEILTEA